MNQEKVIVIDFGGQYNQLVARRVRECNVYCEIYSYKTPLEQIKAMNPKGIILTGGPNSCYEEGSPTCTKELFELGVPVLGLCYGAQLMQHVLGGKVEKAPVREYGKTETFVDKSSALFGDVSEKTIVWMSHFDYISHRENTFTMEEFAASINEFLAFRRYEILPDRGKISRKMANDKAEQEYQIFNRTQVIESDFDREVKKMIQKNDD